MKNVILVFTDNFKQSMGNFKKLNVLSVTALLIALNLVLESFRIQISPELKITFSFLAIALIGALAGPAVGIFAGFVSDILAYILTPQTSMFFPGYTFNAMLTGFIYGVGLYNKRLTMIRCFIVRAIINVVINIGLNSLWLSFFTGKAVYVLVFQRTLKNIILLPIEAILLYCVANAVVLIYKKVKVN